MNKTKTIVGVHPTLLQISVQDFIKDKEVVHISFSPIFPGTTGFCYAYVTYKEGS